MCHVTLVYDVSCHIDTHTHTHTYRHDVSCHIGITIYPLGASLPTPTQASTNKNEFALFFPGSF